MEKNNQLITIRKLMPADIPAAQDITLRSWLATYSRFIPEVDLRSYFDEHYSSQALTAFFSAPDNSGFIAEAHGAAAGYCRTHFDRQEERFYIPSLIFLPSIRTQASELCCLSAPRALQKRTVFMKYGWV